MGGLMEGSEAMEGRKAESGVPVSLLLVDPSVLIVPTLLMGFSDNIMLVPKRLRAALLGLVMEGFST